MLSNLFKVETLDSRFIANDGRPIATKPSRWNTLEFYFYYAAFLTIPILMFKSVYDVSQPSHPTFSTYEHLLEEGWIPGRKVDNSDAQYAGFRDNIPYMGLLVVLHPLLRRIYASLRNKDGITKPPVDGDERKNSAAREAEARMLIRLDFDVLFSVIFIVALHGISALKVLLILSLNFWVGRQLPPKFAGIATWIFNIGVLFANELFHGYRFVDILPYLPFIDIATAVEWGSWLDGFGGLIPRWEILFNITVLRLIAFNFDYLWRDQTQASVLEKRNLSPERLTERERVSAGARPDDFTFHNYLAYILYSPLYLTGPIICFNDFIHQNRYPLPSITWTRTIPYAIRFVICLLTMEVVLHFLYAVAISKSDPDWSLYTPFQLSMLGYFNLHIIWLKLLLPWRFFRLWSLVDGIDPPENMVRCMSNNFSALAFWRGWHRSFNQFIIRYIYIPMGGSQKSKVRSVLNYLSVFTFVALWHDINLQLLMWGWLITLFVAPEVLATLAFPAKRWKNSPNAYRVLCGVGAVGNILMMMIANLVGFAVGLDGITGLMSGIIGSFGGRIFFLSACMTLFVGAQVMFEVRESERRRGVFMKC